MRKNRIKSGTITLESVYCMLSTIIVLLFVFEVFSNGLNQMVVKSNFKEITYQNSAKTEYQSYGRDAADSTIYVK